MERRDEKLSTALAGVKEEYESITKSLKGELVEKSRDRAAPIRVR